VTAEITAGAAPAVVELPSSDVVPVARGRNGRVIGVLVADRTGVRYLPTTDTERLALVRAAAVAAVAGAGLVAAVLRRPGPRVERLTMGPGGWVSFRGGAGRRPRPAGRRPWWAVVLGAHRLDSRCRRGWR
jgi:hypothetical protein